jgi:hypothetical protein
MPRAVSKVEHGKMLDHRFIPLYIASLTLMFHGYVVAYVNSSLLNKYLSTLATSTIYIIASALTVLIFLFISRVLHKVGNFKLTLAFVLIDLIAVLGISFADSMRIIAPLIITHLIVLSLIIFNIDVFMEEHIGNDEGVTGTRRGLLLALVSAVSAIAPFISSELVSIADGSFKYAYLASALSLIPILFILLFYFRDFQDPEYTDLHALEAIASFWQKKDIRAVFIVHFVLQIFFMVMVVFTPIYLIKHIGLSWAEFGMVMFICQLAYVIMEYPIGIVADRLIGEKEMMAFGLMLLAISTAGISFVDVKGVFIWSLVMFVTRIGAAFVEVTTEVHFFKRTQSSDAQIISFFRITRPLSYIVGATVASLSLLYLPFNLLFIVIAFLMIPAMFITLDIEDTK